MERLDRKTCRAINGTLQGLSRIYWPTQSKAMDACLVALDEQGIMPLGELLMLDENGRGSFELERDEKGLQHMLVISTYQMQSGKYELNAYLS